MTDREMLEKILANMGDLNTRIISLESKVDKGFSDVTEMLRITQKHLQTHEHTLKLISK